MGLALIFAQIEIDRDMISAFLLALAFSPLLLLCLADYLGWW